MATILLSPQSSRHPKTRWSHQGTNSRAAQLPSLLHYASVLSGAWALPWWYRPLGRSDSFLTFEIKQNVEIRWTCRKKGLERGETNAFPSIASNFAEIVAIWPLKKKVCCSVVCFLLSTLVDSRNDGHGGSSTVEKEKMRKNVFRQETQLLNFKKNILLYLLYTLTVQNY